MSGHCYFGHNLKISSDAFPWGCDARHQPGGCKCGDGTSRFTAGKTRWRCDICDFDYCGPCYSQTVRSRIYPVYIIHPWCVGFSGVGFVCLCVRLFFPNAHKPCIK